MSRLNSALKKLAEGVFICSVQYPEEYEALEQTENRQTAEKWLGEIGYRLARLSEEGAFFMAHSIVTLEMRNALRDEMKAARSKLEPIVAFFETLRESQKSNPHIHPGDMIWETEVSEAVRTSAILSRRMSEMREINNVKITDPLADRVRKMLNQMANEGYLVETNHLQRGYKVTGKVEYLYQLLAFIAENTSHLTRDEVDELEDAQMTLSGSSVAPVEGAGPQGPL